MSLETLIKTIFKKELPLMISSGVVEEVNGDTCLVSREGLPELVDVRLNSIEESEDSFVRITPVIGSVVLCGLIENDETEAFVISTSEVKQLEVKIKDGSKALITKEEIVLNDGQNGGLTITPELIDQLQKNNAIIDAFKQVLMAPIPEAGLGAPSAFQAACAAAIIALPTGDFSSIENDKVIH